MTLSEYVLKRNGMPLGSQGSLFKYLEKLILVLKECAVWKYGTSFRFYLSKNIYLPLNRHLSKSMSSIVTFGVSGALHDLAIGFVGRDGKNFLMIWFDLGFYEHLKISEIRYGSFSFFSKAIINISSIANGKLII